MGRRAASGGGSLPPGVQQQREHLVTVEAQREFDLFSGEWAERVFVKLYVAARTSGLLATISDRDWKTLCTLATYMDGEGFCFPSQAELARALGCSRQMANERVKSLAAFRFQDQPVLTVMKAERRPSGTWARNGYQVLGLANMRIYDPAEPGNDSANASPIEPAPTVSSFLDTVSAKPTTVSSPTVTVQLDTNKKLLTKPEFEDSTLRRPTLGIGVVEPPERLDTGAAPPTVLPLAAAITAWRETQQQASPEGAAAAKPRAPRRRRQEDPGYQVIQGFMRDFGREFNDRAPLAASTVRAVNLWQASGTDLPAFIERLYAARTIVKERTAVIRSTSGENAAGFPVKHGMGYFFAVLADLCGLRAAGAAEGGADAAT